MARQSPVTPAGHGELLTRPPVSEWSALANANARAAAQWRFEICDVSAPEWRRRARAEAVVSARAFSSKLGVPIAEVADEPDLIVMTGHQPQLYHPGIWVKDFLLQRVAEETGAAAIDVVVDSDGFDTVEIHSPCMLPEVRICRQYLAVGTADGCYVCAPSPSATELDTFCEAVDEQISTLAAPAVRHHFATFCEALRSAAGDAQSLAELVTFARRRYETTAGTDYLELPITLQSRSVAFSAFACDLAYRAERFAADYNAELDAYRQQTGTRSAAQPFPDLKVEGSRVELPLWVLQGDHRVTLWAELDDGCRLVTTDGVIAELPPECSQAPQALLATGARVAPKALALTMFERMFVADLFIHGVGGGRYDRVTDGVVRRFYGVEPPPFVAASLTMYLPLGARVVGDQEIEELIQRVNRVKQNPDQMLGEVEFDDIAERERASLLAKTKVELVSAISARDADKKALGQRIKEVNAELAGLLEPFSRELEQELASLKQLREASEILTDRTYPLCFWSPQEVADKAR